MKKLFLAIIAASIFTFVANGANHSEMNKVEKVNTSHSVMANTGTEKHGMNIVPRGVHIERIRKIILCGKAYSYQVKGWGLDP